MISKKTILIKTFMLSMLVLTVAFKPGRGEGFYFKDQLYTDTTLHFDHHHLDRDEITGHTRLRYEIEVINGQAYQVEYQQNRRSDGTVFSEKQVRFDLESGQLIRYTETDFRSGVTIRSAMVDGEIITQVQDGADETEIRIPVTDGLVLFETLTLSLRQMLPDLLKNRQAVPFTLYLPVLASELEKKGLPLSLSQLQMMVRVVADGETETAYGRQWIVQLQLKPASMLISALLPKDKSEFRFSFIARPPYHLVAFEEGRTRSVLAAVETAAKQTDANTD
jgi:hypothetical protein